MTMLIGSTISGPDNDAYFFEGVPEGVLCPRCGSCLDYAYVPSALRLPSTHRDDISATYDHRRIVSRRFANFLNDELGFSGIVKQICSDPDYFYIFPAVELPFDSEKRDTRFETKCRLCGGFESVVGATPAYLKTPQIPRCTFCRTDLAFGSGKEKFPLFVIDLETKKLLQGQEFQGMLFKDVLS